MRRLWTEQELSLLRQLYPDQAASKVAQTLRRSLSSVYAQAAILGLKKSDAFLQSDLSGRIQRGKQDPRMVSTQFKKGLTPWNKGSHFVAGGRSHETRFKKGYMSGAAQHNYVPIGSLRVTKDGYLERKVTDDPNLVPARRWVAVHRLVWEAAHGAIPDGHVVVYKPGMKTAVLEQVTLDRLECISRAELIWRNHPARKCPELARLVQLKGAITRQVNRINREHQQRGNKNESSAHQYPKNRTA